MHFLTRYYLRPHNIILTGKQTPRHLTTATRNLKNTRDFEDIQIPAPWGGCLAAKWYGLKNVRPIVGLHGWQDNAGTFDTLAPLLTPHIPLLNIDMPGHGLSTWLPNGWTYHSVYYVLLLLHLMDEFQWDKISIMGHSMSSINGGVFSAIFPNKVDMLISLDDLKPLTRSPAEILDTYAARIEGTLKFQKFLRKKTEPPTYDWEQLEQRLHDGSKKSVELEKCKYLLQRNTKPAQEASNKFYFSRDSRLKTLLAFAFPQDVSMEIMRRIQCPHLYIKALDAPFEECKEYLEEALAVRKNSAVFEYHEVEGTHHVHLNAPQKVSDILNAFICKWRPPE